MSLVSVIIPNYNNFHLLFRAIGSVLSQSYENFEIIVIDDSSTESIGEIPSSLCDKRVSYIQNDGKKGVAAARNAGLRIAKGAYIAFLDSDDEFLVDHLRESVSALEDEKDVSLVFGTARYIEDGNDVDYMGPSLIKKVAAAPRNTDKGAYIVFEDFLFDYMLKAGCFFNISSVVMRRAVIDRQFFMNETIGSTADMEYWQRLSYYFKFLYLKNAQIVYHLHGDNMSFVRSEEGRDRATDEMIETYRIMLAYEFLTPAQKSAIARNMADKYFGYGYHKRQILDYNRARWYYEKSFMCNPRLRTLKAYVSVSCLELASMFGFKVSCPGERQTVKKV